MDKYLWCLHCERTYMLIDESDKHECQYPDCDGSMWDLWDWNKVKRGHPEYPTTPRHGIPYPLY